MTEPGAATGDEPRFSPVAALAGAAFALSVIALQVGSARYQRNLSDLLEILAPAVAAWSAVRAARRAAGAGGAPGGTSSPPPLRRGAPDR